MSYVSCYVRRDDPAHPADSRGNVFRASRVPNVGERVSLVAREGGHVAFVVDDVLHVEPGSLRVGEDDCQAVLDVRRVSP